MATRVPRPRTCYTAAIAVLAALLVPLAAPAAEPSANAPREFRAIYLTYWSAATPSRVDRVVELAREGIINAVVIDVKNVTGYVAFDTRVEDVERYHAKRVVIRDIDGLVDRLHREGLYVIARIVVFTDPKLAVARPELAVHSAAKLAAAGGVLSTATLWRDRRKLAWIDPASTEAWKYNTAIARDALSRGFDEINFDYIRFPSDGDMKDMRFPVWDQSVPRHLVIRNLFAYLRRGLGSATISVDLFGLSTVNRDDLGVGQVIEDAFPYFDYVCPMVYPSHYAPGFIGKANPAEYPYEVVYYSMKTAAGRLAELETGTGRKAKLRPWLQDFHLGATYTTDMVEAQVRATRDALGGDYAGFVMWNPRNVYNQQALELVPAEAPPEADTPAKSG